MTRKRMLLAILVVIVLVIVVIYLIPVPSQAFDTIYAKVDRPVVESLRKFRQTFAWTMGGEYTLRITPGYPATVNDPQLAEFVRAMATDLLGADLVHEASMQMGAEDFSFMARVKPATFFNLGAKKDNVPRPHHNARFDIDESVLPTGAALLAEAARRYLTQ